MLLRGLPFTANAPLCPILAMAQQRDAGHPGDMSRAVRHQQDLTQAQLAEAIGVDDSIGRFDTGVVQLLSADKLAQLAQVLGLRRIVMLRVAVLLGPANILDVLAECRRVTALPTDQASLQAFQHLPREA